MKRSLSFSVYVFTPVCNFHGLRIVLPCSTRVVGNSHLLPSRYPHDAAVIKVTSVVKTALKIWTTRSAKQNKIRGWLHLVRRLPATSVLPEDASLVLWGLMFSQQCCILRRQYGADWPRWFSKTVTILSFSDSVRTITRSVNYACRKDFGVVIFEEE